VIPRVYVIDTSYLVELFRIPGFSQESAVKKVRKRYSIAIENASRLYVPLPCIFELGDHIAKVDNGNSRRKAGKVFCDTITSSVERNIPWIITPSTEIELLPRFCEIFLENCVKQCIGLTDTFTIQEAHRLKKKYVSFGYKVHIWTKDKSLKAHEPDFENDPFLE